MFHVEMRMGMHVVREFNLDDRKLYVTFLEPLLSDREFSIEGHDYYPRHTRIVILEGPELPLDQLGMGRGWGNAERTATDVTESVLAKARAHLASHSPASATPTGPAAASAAAQQRAQAPAPTPAPAVAVSVPDALRERLIGRLSAGPVTLADIAAIAADLMPESPPEEQLAASRGAALELLSAGDAHLSR
jgi:hypothetical protein